MREQKRIIFNEYGEAVRVTEEDYEKWKKENQNINENKAPTFEAPKQENRVESLGKTEEQKQRIKEKLKTLELKEAEVERLDKEIEKMDQENEQDKSTEEKENGR